MHGTGENVVALSDDAVNGPDRIKHRLILAPITREMIAAFRPALTLI